MSNDEQRQLGRFRLEKTPGNHPTTAKVFIDDEGNWLETVNDRRSFDLVPRCYAPVPVHLEPKQRDGSRGVLLSLTVKIPFFGKPEQEMAAAQRVLKRIQVSINNQATATMVGSDRKSRPVPWVDHE